MFPPSLIARLFLRGSLKNNETGFEFRIKNIIDSGTITALILVKVDDTSYAPAQCKVTLGENEISGDQVTREHPISIRAQAEVKFSVEGQPLSDEPHKIMLQIGTREAGKLTLSVTEPVTA